MASSSNEKSLIREKVWSQLRKVALPDSRFHHDYSSFIADFQGSKDAITLLTSLPHYQNAPIIFIAPDNCLQALRLRALEDGKKVLVTTYGIRRGFFLLDPVSIDRTKYEICSLLDGMELYGRNISLSDLDTLLRQLEMKIPLMVTGTGAISSRNGLRFGKGHGFFDLEWGMLHFLSLVNEDTKTVAVVHECQVLDEELVGEEWDTGCDFVVTEKRVIEVEGARKPSCGILWEKLEVDMLENIEPLRELRDLRLHSGMESVR